MGGVGVGGGGEVGWINYMSELHQVLEIIVANFKGYTSGDMCDVCHNYNIPNICFLNYKQLSFPAWSVTAGRFPYI